MHAGKVSPQFYFIFHRAQKTRQNYERRVRAFPPWVRKFVMASTSVCCAGLRAEAQLVAGMFERPKYVSQLTTNPCLLARVFLCSLISVDRVQIAGSLKVLKDLIFVAAGRRMKASPPPELQVPVFFLKDLGSRARETLLLSPPSSEVT